MLAADAVEQLHRFGLFLDALGLGRELLVHHGGFGRARLLDGDGPGLLSLCFGDGLLFDHVGFGGAFFLQGIRLGRLYFGFRQAFRSHGGPLALGQHLLGRGFLLGSRPLGLGFDDNLFGGNLGTWSYLQDPNGVNAESGATAAANVRNFVEAGGGGIAAGSAAEAIASTLELPVTDYLVDRQPGQPDRALGSEKFYVPGSIVRVAVDTTAPSAVGANETMPNLCASSGAHRSTAITLPPFSS